MARHDNATGAVQAILGMSWLCVTPGSTKKIELRQVLIRYSNKSPANWAGDHWDQGSRLLFDVPSLLTERWQALGVWLCVPFPISTIHWHGLRMFRNGRRMGISTVRSGLVDHTRVPAILILLSSQGSERPTAPSMRRQAV